MQPSELEIQREVETLRDIRRRSSTQGGPGALLIDPDLPASSSQSSSGYWSPSDDASSSSSHEDSVDPDSTILEGDPSHLFWVPARLHPEIAPAEFRQFLKEHARTPADGSISRSSSVSSTGLGRKKSMLSRQYKPSENDNVEEEEKVLPIRRNRSSVYAAPQLTISDLQKLEELAEEASRSDDPTKLRSVLRRSLSLNLAPTALADLGDMLDMGDEADSPIMVPRPGQILRRTQRTKIRKPGQTSEGPHRFSSARARRGSGRSATHEGYIPSDRSSSDHGDESTQKSAESDVAPAPRPESYSEESSIYDAYVREEPETPEPPPSADIASEFAPVKFEPILSALELSEPQPTPVLQHPQPQRVLSPPAPEITRSPSPEPTPPAQAEVPVSPRPPLTETPVYQPPSSPQPTEGGKREKDKKGLFGKWGGDKNSKKANKEAKEKEKEKEKEKDGGFFGSLFGKKKQEDSTPPIGGLGNNGRETAAALLGASKSSKNYVPSPSPQPIQGYARYPIHVERAIYRLSHIKLANPRRPLYEQVLISNLMFWYLGVINKSNSSTQVNSAANAANDQNGSAAEKEKAEREKKEREEREKTERERAERERAEKKESSRKGSLTKVPAGGNAGGRRAEMPVRGPQYEMQHRAMEQEYGYGQPGTPSMGRTASAPPAPAGYTSNRTSGNQPNLYHPPSQQAYSSVQLVQPQPQAAQGRHHNGMANPSPSAGAPQLPPGAMPPVNIEANGWITSPPGTPTVTPNMQRNHTSPSPPPRGSSPTTLSSSPAPRRAKSPPARYSPAQEKQLYTPGGGRTPGRSLSATAVPPMPPTANGIRKGNTFHAVPAHRQQQASEEEDVPLALYQQRRKP